MKVQIRRYAVATAAIGALAAVGAFALPTGSAGWEPVTYGLTASPEQLLPATVSAEKPARVVTTTIGEDGKPVITVKEATDKASAAKLVEDGQGAEDAVSVEVDAKMYALGIPTGSDPSRSQQWDFSKLKIAEAWKKSTGENVTVAVIDSGVDSKHPDLAGNVLSGYDAISNKAGTITDGNGHGTHVAGTISAVTGNGVGISAVAPNAKILPVKALGSNGSGNMSDAAEGIIWATDHGAQVINMSLGSTQKVTAVTNAVNYARSKGVTVIAAAGNSRTSGSPISYPAADAGVIAVAATDSNDRYGSYSNAGSYVDVAAPGSNILSTYPTALGSAYKSMNGTSMASPHIAAVAALLKAANPALTPDQIEAAMEETAVDLGTKGFDKDYGNGRVDPVAALAAVAPVTTPPTTAPTTAPTAPSTGAPVTSAPTKAPTSAPVTTAPTTGAPVTTVPGKVTPVITVNSTSPEVAYGTSTVTTFSVQAGGKAWALQGVSVCVSEAGGAVQCTDTKTTEAGTVAVTRTAKASYEVYVQVAESNTTTAVTSAKVGYKVRATVNAVRSGTGLMTITINGATGQTAQVQQNVRGTWKTVLTFKASASVRIGGLVRGQQYRVVLPDTAAVLGATSPTVTA
ncbi:S8 family peptidase [Actinoplanes aureus]|uniref:Peptidase S8 n=1 Tax=Actinoplanes aureus TaxID=2792083 RepID=A0A931C0Q8_9ACTN|nr:S8 family peptidase [Actinoplanes aureus]MBG0560164.1 peptidase S8 [Actinoplanes aureus]